MDGRIVSCAFNVEYIIENRLKHRRTWFNITPKPFVEYDDARDCLHEHIRLMPENEFRIVRREVMNNYIPRRTES